MKLRFIVFNLKGTHVCGCLLCSLYPSAGACTWANLDLGDGRTNPGDPLDDVVRVVEPCLPAPSRQTVLRL